MGIDDYVEESCNECGSHLIQLDGDWVCEECSGEDVFSLIPDRQDFAL